MIMNVEQSSFSGVVLNVSRLVGIEEIIQSINQSIVDLYSAYTQSL